MTLAIVKRTEDEFNEFLSDRAVEATQILEKMGMKPNQLLATELGWLYCLSKYRNAPLDFDIFQLRFLGNKNPLRSVLKCRQAGFSFECGAEATARSHLREAHLALFVSYNLDDAKEKIQYVKELHEELPLEFQRKLKRDSKTEVGFESNSRKRTMSRVISYPSRAPRGKSGDIYLDEIAHMLNDRAIYSGSTAVISRYGGQLTIGSTPLGQKGIFYEIHTRSGGAHTFPGYWRQNVPWWLCKRFCNNLALAAVEAPDMTTQERVQKFATPDFMTQFEALPLEDFQQEYELAFNDEAVSFYPYALIDPCTVYEAEDLLYDSLQDLAEAELEGTLYAGFDVGRTRHPSELVIFERIGDVFWMRFQASFKDCPFHVQYKYLADMLNLLGGRLKVLRIDATGNGSQLGEDLRRKFGQRVDPVKFTSVSKSDFAYSLRALLESQTIALPRDRTIRAQIHCIKQKYTNSGNVIFDVDRNERNHHADKLWAIAMATFRRAHKTRQLHSVGVRIIKPPEKVVVSTQLDEVGRIADPSVNITQIPTAVLEQKARALAISIRVWMRSGDDHRVRAVKADYARLRREIKRRQAAALK